MDRGSSVVLCVSLAWASQACGSAADGDPAAGTGSDGTATGSDGGSPAEEADGSGSSSGEASSSESSTGDPIDEEPVVECETERCTTACTATWEVLEEDGTVLTCTDATSVPNENPACDLPYPCGKFGDGIGTLLCVTQALRWGVVGRYVWSTMEEDVGGVSAYLTVLEPGRAEGVSGSFLEHVGCQGMSEHTSFRYHAANVPAPDDPFWSDCRTGAESWDVLPKCIDPAVVLMGECAAEPFSPCPEPPWRPDPEAPCEITCPMANDGVCDGPTGTGLCPEECDAIDCTCTEDVRGQCDDVQGGGTCPLGSDQDDCAVG